MHAILYMSFGLMDEIYLMSNVYSHGDSTTKEHGLSRHVWLRYTVMDGARENPDRLLESSLLFGGLAGRQIFVSIHFCCLFIIFMGVHPLTLFLCFVGERLRPSPRLRARGEEGRQGRRHRRPGRRQRRRFRLGEVRLRPRHVGVGGLPLLHWKVSCQRQHGGGEGEGKCDGEGEGVRRWRRPWRPFARFGLSVVA